MNSVQPLAIKVVGQIEKYISKSHVLSQAAACDGILYRVGPENDNSNPGPGVLPI